VIKAGISRHLFALTRDLAKARKMFKNKEYWKFGNEIGEMLVLALS